MARHAAEPLGERLGVAVSAAGADLRAAPDGVPGRVRPLDRGRLCHRIFVSVAWQTSRVEGGHREGQCLRGGAWPAGSLPLAHAQAQAGGGRFAATLALEADSIPPTRAAARRFFAFVCDVRRN